MMEAEETKGTSDLEKVVAKYHIMKTAFLAFYTDFPFSLFLFRRVSMPYLPSLSLLSPSIIPHSSLHSHFVFSLLLFVSYLK